MFQYILLIEKHVLIRMFCRIPVTSLGASLQKLSGPMPLPTPMAAHMSSFLGFKLLGSFHHVPPFSKVPVWQHQCHSPVLTLVVLFLLHFDREKPPAKVRLRCAEGNLCMIDPRLRAESAVCRRLCRCQLETRSIRNYAI